MRRKASRSDLQMAGLNGLELQEALQSQGHQTPVIVIAAYPNKKHRTRALENGAISLLSKPFDETNADRMPDGCDQVASQERPTICSLVTKKQISEAASFEGV
jgi:FixJ family two-component response regulator